VEVSARARESGPTRCPLCHDEVRVYAQVLRPCDECEALHHADCWVSNGEKCASCDAGPRAKKAEGRAPRAVLPATPQEPPILVQIASALLIVGVVMGSIIGVAALAAHAGKGMRPASPSPAAKPSITPEMDKAIAEGFRKRLAEEVAGREAREAAERAAQEAANSRTFTIGSSMDEVRAAQGPPRGVEAFGSAGWIWSYGSDSVSFDGHNRVDGWKNNSGRLKVR
jgi:hypothetical protein